MGRKENKVCIPEVGPIPIGMIMRARRNFLGLKPKDVAEQAGYNIQYLRNVETCNERPTYQLLSELAIIYGFQSAEELVETPRLQIIQWVESKQKRNLRTTENVILPETSQQIMSQEARNKELELLQALQRHTLEMNSILSELIILKSKKPSN